jgi:hypothetical protein
LHSLRAAAPKRSAARTAQFEPKATPEGRYTLRLRLIKLAARVIEKATRIRVALASACPDKVIFAHLARALVPQGP